VLAILGTKDEYSTRGQIEAIRRHAVHAAGVELLELEDCGHAPQRDRPQDVLQALVRFVERCR